MELQIMFVQMNKHNNIYLGVPICSVMNNQKRIDIIKQYKMIGRGYKTKDPELHKLINQLKNANATIGKRFAYTQEVRQMMDDLQKVFHQLEVYRLEQTPENPQGSLFFKGFSYSWQELQAIHEEEVAQTKVTI
jgi:hypothetical protein